MPRRILVKSVEAEVSKPFSEKLTRSKQLIKLFANTPGACASVSFGKDSMTILHLLLQENARIPVVFENTLIEFPETLILEKKVAHEWDLNFIELRPASGVNFWKINDRITKECLIRDDGKKHSNICCYHLKERPFTIWRKAHSITRSFTGLTALESRHRMFVACKKGMEYYSFRDGCYKVHPIIYWTPEEVWAYTKDNQLPVNEAYAKYGLDRVGCMWCMSHHFWRRQVAKINPRVYSYMMRRYFGTPTITEKWEP